MPIIQNIKPPKISVIIPVFNVENYLSNCLDSVINQTLKDIEIIIVNDGSTDNCDEICKTYTRKDNRINYIKKQNEGVSIARNIGMSNASGEYIYCIDSDDTIKPEYLNEIYVAFKQQDCDFLWIESIHTHRDKNFLGCLPTCSYAIKKTLFNNNPNLQYPPKLQPCEDGLFSHMAIALANKTGHLLSNGYTYTQRINSSEHSITKKQLITDIPKWFKILDNFYGGKDLSAKQKLHLLAFIAIEPFGRFKNLPFSKNDQILLFNLIHSFITKYKLLTNTNITNFSLEFRLFLKSKNYTDYVFKMTLLNFYQKLFSIKNEYKNNEKKHKVITFIGIKFKIKIKKRVPSA